MAAVRFTAVILVCLLPAAVLSYGFPATLKLERAVPANHEMEISQLKARDRARHGRLLQSLGGVIDFPVDGTFDPFVVGLYYTKLRLGSPPRDFYVQIDTGSDVLWVSCASCNGCPQTSGLQIQLNFFDPGSSVTATPISCSDQRCSWGVQSSDSGCSVQNNLCAYTFQYGDGSGTSGFYVSDVLQFDMIVGSSLVPNSTAQVVFGCSTSQTGDLVKSDRAVDGIFGFGQQGMSVISQLASQGLAPRVFSHCLKGENGGGGILVLGEIVEPNIVFTPLVPSQPHYNVNLLSISVNGQALPINPSVFSTSNGQGTIIDTGTTLAYLSEEAYVPFVEAITTAVSRSVRPVVSKGNQCYIIATSVADIFPPVSFNFAGAYPRFNVAVRGQKITLKFQVPSTCEVAQLISNIGTKLGVKVSDRTGGSDMLLRAWDNPVAWQITLRSVESKKEVGGSEDDADEDLCILIFGSLITSDKVEVEFIKKGSLTNEELEAFVSALQVAGTKAGQNKGGSAREASTDKTVSQLESMGVRIYGVNKPLGDDSVDEISWDNIAGYDQQKREIEDTILMALHSPEVYDDIVRGTRSKFESNRPRAVLFEGPPGTGKTSCARVIANQAGIPLLYVPLEAVMSKYYGESERLLGAVFSQANELSDGAIIFLDEIDAFAISRDNEMHEATRRVLSVLLRQIDGFEQDKKVVVIAATNRKQDLDSALISRFDSMIMFDLPDLQTRQDIIAQYAKQLSKPELVQLAQATESMSGRDIRDVCQGAERTWASKLIRRAKADGIEQKITLPPIQEYLESAEARRKALVSVREQREQNLAVRSKKPLLDFE